MKIALEIKRHLRKTLKKAAYCFGSKG